MDSTARMARASHPASTVMVCETAPTARTSSTAVSPSLALLVDPRVLDLEDELGKETGYRQKDA